MRITYFREELGGAIQKIVPLMKDLQVDINYEGPLVPNSTELIHDGKKRWWQFLMPEPTPPPIGGIPIEGLPDLLTEGITLTEHFRNLLIDAAVVYKLYYELEKRRVHNTGKEGVSNRRDLILQIVTDDHRAEWGEADPSKKTISFIFRGNITEPQFVEGYKRIPDMRDSILKVFSTLSSKNTNKVRCVFDGIDWDVEFVSKRGISID